jgi:outer membrane immunogenic protein
MHLKRSGSILAALFGAAVCADAAFAGDVDPSRSAVAALPAPPAFSWSGFYVGVHGGYGWASSHWTLTGAIPPSAFPIVGTQEDMQSSGLLAGVQLGFDHQFGNWVAGFEAELSLITSDASATVPLPATLSFETGRSQTNWLATFTARGGYAFDRSLFYVKGGVAGAEFKDSAWLTDVAGGYIDFGNQTDTHLGWTIGAGYEYAILDNWTAKIEYDYLDFGTTREAFSANEGGTSAQWNQSIAHKLQQVEAGFNYRF